MVDIYERMFGKEPVVSAVHAGLECGLFLGKRPDLDCVSFGPNILDIHSFNEKLDIASTERTWEFLKEILKELKIEKEWGSYCASSPPTVHTVHLILPGYLLLLGQFLASDGVGIDFFVQKLFIDLAVAGL